MHGKKNEILGLIFEILSISAYVGLIFAVVLGIIALII